MFKEEVIRCPRCGGVLAKKIKGEYERLYHLKGSKLEVFVGTEKLTIVCNHKRLIVNHKEVCNEKVTLEIKVIVPKDKLYFK